MSGRIPPRPRTYGTGADEWHLEGACRDEDETLFYHPDDERGSARWARAAAAKAICRECPVMLLCRERSIAQREPYGVWGGLSEDERGRLLSGRPIEGPLNNRPENHPYKMRIKAAPVAAPPPLEAQPSTPGRRILIADPRVPAHVQVLLNAGHTVDQIADVAGLNYATVRAVASGKNRVTERTANALLALRSATAVAA